MPWLLGQDLTMPPSNTVPKDKPVITESNPGFFEVLLYAPATLSDMLRRLSDLKNMASGKKLKMSPAVGLWLTLALVGVLISANSYFVAFQSLHTDQLTTVIPLGREDTAFAPMALFPPLLLWFSYFVNFGTWLVGLIIPDLPFGLGGTPQWNPAARATVWNSATLALAWWVGFTASVIVSSAQGLFTRTVPLSQQRAYAERLNKIARIELNPKAIAPARREVRKANNYGRAAIWGMCLFAVAGWGWELFLANGALDGSAFDEKTQWIYGLASTFMAEGCWFIAESTGKKINGDI
jgi:hypothetical protein